MPSVGLIYFERENLPGRRRLDPSDPTTVEFDAPVYAFRARHALSELFELRVEFEQDDPNVDLAALLWRRALVDLTVDADDAVSWQGIVEAAEFIRIRDHRAFFEVTIRPAAHRLVYGRDTRIFQQKSVPEIVEALLEPTGQELELHLSESYRPVEYLVQYKESDWELIQRLLADEGLFFWFDHSVTSHVMHIADGSEAHAPQPAPLHYVHGREPGPSQVADICFTTRVVHDAHVTRDWDWQRPNAPLEGSHAEGESRRFERYEFPGGLADEADASRRAQRHQQANSARKYELSGVAGSSSLLPGQQFALLDARPAEVNVDYLLTSVEHEMVSEEASETARHQVGITAIPTSQTFRPSRRVRRPTVSGRETAVITGPPDEEIHVDEFGRVKARFYWDRLAVSDEHSSKWIRTVQPNTAGSMYLPRVGWEVAMAHLYGEPDRPLVTHKLFNERNRPPYALPDSLHLTTWRSSSSPGGAGSNEIRFDDTNGAMELYVHAQRDSHTQIGHDRSESVGLTSAQDVSGRLNTSVGANETVTVGVDERTAVHGSMQAATAGDKTVTVAQLDSWQVERDHSVTNDGDRTETTVGPAIVIANDVSETLQGNRERVVGGAELRRAGGSMVEAVGGDKHESVQGARVTLVAGALSERIGASKRLEGQNASVRTRGSFSITAGDLRIEAGGNLVQGVTDTAGVNGTSVSLEAQDELRARAGGSELVLGGDILDVDAGSLSGSGALVRLLGQIEMIGGDSAEEAQPEDPGPEDDWIEVSLVDLNGNPVGEEEYVIHLPDGSERRGTLDSSGTAREEELPPGTVSISFPNLGPSEADE